MNKKIGALSPMSIFVFAAALSAGTGPSLAAKPFDGEWSVRITAKTGDCSGYTIPIEVTGGRVSYSGFFNAQASGAIRPNGSLNVKFAHEEDIVNASGAVSGSTGSGQWTSPTKGCGGTWTARRG